jgi:hypothetical protein
MAGYAAKGSGRAQRERARYNGAFGKSDMAGGLGSRSGRSVVAVESSGSERVSMELAGSAT